MGSQCHGGDVGLMGNAYIPSPHNPRPKLTAWGRRVLPWPDRDAELISHDANHMTSSQIAKAMNLPTSTVQARRAKLIKTGVIQTPPPKPPIADETRLKAGHDPLAAFHPITWELLMLPSIERKMRELAPRTGTHFNVRG